jgi:mannitol-specific phosphotransferase system IIBC component
MPAVLSLFSLQGLAWVEPLQAGLATAESSLRIVLPAFPTELAQAGAPATNGWILPSVLGIAAGAVLAFVVNLLLGTDAKTQSKRLLDQARLDSENLVKQAELEKKEKLLQMQSAFDA